jgi:hypothetical protein
MATTYKVLGQSAPAAATPSDLYTVPALTSAVCSTLVAANRGAASGTIRISVRPAGATQANQHYIAYDVPVAANNSLFLTLGISLATTDVVTVYASSANFSFNLFGSELT